MEQKVFIYNPTCEMAVVNGDPNYNIPKGLKIFEEALATLIHFFGNSNDFVLCRKYPSKEYIDQFETLSLSIPKHISFSDLEDYLKTSSSLYGIDLQPWGWSPAMHKLLNVFKPFANKAFQDSAYFDWQNEMRNVFS